MKDKDLELEPVDMYVLFAKMFSHITREVEKACGEEGVRAVREGVRQFGLERGRNIAERAKAMGHENDAKSYLPAMIWEEASCLTVKTISGKIP